MKILIGLCRNGFDPKTTNNEVDKKQVKKIVKYLNKIKLRSENRGYKNGNHFNYKSSSYGFKHLLERACGFYVANGDVIQAMHEYGYKIKHIPNSINVRLNPSNEELKHLQT